jgi:hypothetical protein
LILYSIVIPRLGLGIHEFAAWKLVDARPEAGHDDLI